MLLASGQCTIQPSTFQWKLTQDAGQFVFNEDAADWQWVPNGIPVHTFHFAAPPTLQDLLDGINGIRLILPGESVMTVPRDLVALTPWRDLGTSIEYVSGTFLEVTVGADVFYAVLADGEYPGFSFVDLWSNTESPEPGIYHTRGGYIGASATAADGITDPLQVIGNPPWGVYVIAPATGPYAGKALNLRCVGWDDIGVACGVEGCRDGIYWQGLGVVPKP